MASVHVHVVGWLGSTVYSSSFVYSRYEGGLVLSPSNQMWPQKGGCISHMYVIKFMKPFFRSWVDNSFIIFLILFGTMIGKDKIVMFKNSRKNRNFEVSFECICRMYKHTNCSYAGYYLEVRRCSVLNWKLRNQCCKLGHTRLYMISFDDI